MNPQPLKFTNQDLRNCSFRGQILNGADFSGSDIRGCDFSNALLRGASFEKVTAGHLPGKTIFEAITILIVAPIVFYAVSMMVFGVIDRTPEDPLWVYGVALFFSLDIAAVSSAVISSTNKPVTRQIATIICALTNGAILGFFYGGAVGGGQNATIAIASAVIGAIFTASISFYIKDEVVTTALVTAGAVAGYGVTFLTSSRASNLLSTQNLLGGLLFAIVSLMFGFLTVISLIYIVKKITRRRATSFRSADLTNAKFTDAKLGNSDFYGAMGYWGR